MIKIITDSAADYNKEEAAKKGIDIIPLHVRFDDIEFMDGVNLSAEDFYKRLIESSTLPKTAQVTPAEFMAAFEKYPNDQIICITLSKKLSGTYQSAVLASKEFDNVSVIDSETVTCGEKILIDYALSLISDGKEYKEIVDTLNNVKKNVKLIALLDTLEFLKKGGRIGAVTATFGTLLNIKPVVELKAGEVKMAGKARGSKNGNNKLREKINEYGGVDFTKPFAVAYSGLSDAVLTKYIEDSKDLYPENTKMDVSFIGCTIGTHIGPGAIAVAFFAK